MTAAAKPPTTKYATACMPMTKAAMPSATRRRRAALPAVIIATQSRQASRDSWGANQTAVPGWIMGLLFASPAKRGKGTAPERGGGAGLLGVSHYFPPPARFARRLPRERGRKIGTAITR